MNPGELNRKIQFGTFSQTKATGQNYVQTFTPVPELTDGETWAKVRPKNGHREQQGGEPVIIKGSEIIIRYRQDFTPTKQMFILYQDQYYVIHDISDWEDQRRFYKLFTSVRDGES